MSNRAAAAAALLLLASLVACKPPIAASDGFPIGPPADCGQDACARFYGHASTWLDTAEPGHQAIVGAQAFLTAYRDPSGNGIILTTRSGGHDLIVVLYLADGSTRTRHVGCGVGVDTERCFDLSLEDALAGLGKG